MPTPKQKAAPKHQTDRNTSLPQTSEQQSTALTLLGVLILGIIGLATTNKKRKRS
ncbi:LPXTG cell wall anchor domain-containing protein [Lacticaseibacillus chiayiensis]|nr:LPXTG cell wall anchor domain-containing protein [Lacticaseibacillus chiayiensis]